MSVFSLRLTALLGAGSLIVLTSCSGPVAGNMRTPGFYWSAARETYAAGDFVKTTDHLDHLISGPNDYTSRAIPWSLVLTSGMAEGYMELADNYAVGAHSNKSQAPAFLHKAMVYRTSASRLALQFAQDLERMDQVPAGAILLDFTLPIGTAAAPPHFAQIAKGAELAQSDEETALALAIQRNVMLAACLAAGAPNDAAKAEAILRNGSASIPRATFAKALAKMLDDESSLYTRNKLDDPGKLALFHQRAHSVLDDAVTFGTARVLRAQATVR
jgi:hypothetical protein